MAAAGASGAAVAVGSSTMVISTMLGMGGAGLAGYKMSKRTGGGPNPNATLPLPLTLTLTLALTLTRNGGVEEFSFEHLGGEITGSEVLTLTLTLTLIGSGRWDRRCGDECLHLRSWLPRSTRQRE